MSHKSLAAICAIASLLVAATGCGGSGDDEGTPAAPPAPAPAPANTSTPYDGAYEMRLTPAGARKVPEPSITAGNYRLILAEGKYAIGSDRGPFGGGSLTASSGRLRFGPNPDSVCTTATGSYAATVGGGALRLRALEDTCEDRKAFLERSWRRR